MSTGFDGDAAHSERGQTAEQGTTQEARLHCCAGTVWTLGIESSAWRPPCFCLSKAVGTMVAASQVECSSAEDVMASFKSGVANKVGVSRAHGRVLR